MAVGGAGWRHTCSPYMARYGTKNQDSGRHGTSSPKTPLRARKRMAEMTPRSKSRCKVDVRNSGSFRAPFLAYLPRHSFRRRSLRAVWGISRHFRSSSSYRPCQSAKPRSGSTERSTNQVRRLLSIRKWRPSAAIPIGHYPRWIAQSEGQRKTQK